MAGGPLQWKPSNLQWIHPRQIAQTEQNRKHPQIHLLVDLIDGQGQLKNARNELGKSIWVECQELGRHPERETMIIAIGP